MKTQTEIQKLLKKNRLLRRALRMAAQDIEYYAPDNTEEMEAQLMEVVKNIRIAIRNI